MTTLKIIAGFPGSGKSEYIKKIKTQYSGCVADDYMKDSIDNSRDFDRSRFYKELIEHLQKGNDCIISDIEFCRTHRREEFKKLIESRLSEITLDWTFFRIDTNCCVIRVAERAREQWRVEVMNIFEFEKEYKIPASAQSIPDSSVSPAVLLSYRENI